MEPIRKSYWDYEDMEEDLQRRYLKPSKKNFRKTKSTKSKKLKVYLLCFDKSDRTILLPVNADSRDHAPGCPSLFGGTRDYDLTQSETALEALARELFEESSGLVQLEDEAVLHRFYETQYKGVHYQFYWTCDFKESIFAFRGNTEKKDIHGVHAGHLSDYCPTRFKLAEHLFFLLGAADPHAQQQFRHSLTLKAIWTFLELCRNRHPEFLI